MSIQTEQHFCNKKPEYVYVMRHRIDGRWTEWDASFSATSREGTSTSNLHIVYCPFCGKELEHG